MNRIGTPEELDKFRKTIQDKKDPNQSVVTICGGTGCLASGAGKINESFKEEIEKQNLEDKVSIRNTGCHGFCERGPIIVIHPEEICYFQIEPKDIPEIISETIKGRRSSSVYSILTPPPMIR